MALTQNQVNDLKKEACTKLKTSLSLPFDVQGKAGKIIWCKEDPNDQFKSILTKNCLPVHVAILPKVKQMGLGKNPGIVIGLLQKDTPKDLDKCFSDKVSYFMPKGDITNITQFHAWIQLDLDDAQSDVIDIVGAYNKGISVDYLNHSNAKSADLRYFPVLTEAGEVFEFHAKLVSCYFLKEEASVQNMIHYLLNVAHHLSVSKDIVLGSFGRYLIGMMRPNNEVIIIPSRNQSINVEGWQGAFNLGQKYIDLVLKVYTFFYSSRKK
ncbi:hypothetical protein [Vibrio lentus]|uniref:hypothetical protein n=1 Tax=Vibrio lentus TaxID=136468 RepID=UPI000C843939|nr:hypothetical protein [Vibrio lentus]PMK96896.1 hypothetical protein BCT89_10080 [Vibrio lentus]PML51272.1 hypothetical protein BCT75_11585 [Vibrio lentus]